MANQEQLDILKQGVEAWNQWRGEHMDIQPDLTNASLHMADLSGANLRKANFTQAKLTNADLSFADLTRANLEAANLFGAILSDAILSSAYLVNADLYNANLVNADLSLAALRLANLSGASVGWTILGDVDLSVVKGLETVQHAGPSTIGIDTIYRSKGNVPEVFLRKAGVPETFLTNMRALVDSMRPIDFYSCFISYSSKDDAFARKLHADLQSENVRCWFAPEDLKWGERIHIGIDEAIRLHDKLLLILSRHSIASGWVEREVKAALAKERKEKRTVLFPVRVDNAVLECPYAWATEIRHERNIGNFTKWKNHDEYQKAFTRLLRDLKAEAKKTEEL